MKQVVEQDLHIPVANMKLFREGASETEGAELGDAQSLEALGLPVGAISKLELRIVYLQEHAQPTDYTMPDVIDVEVHFGADIPPKLMQVPIERASKKKPFLGGFRSKKTGAEFHHACSIGTCLLYTSPSPRDQRGSRMPSSA